MDRLIAVPAARAHIDAVVADPILKACMHNVLDGLPAVDAVPVVHGRWVPVEGNIFKREQCSSCGAGKAYGEIYHYCPNCGAKMDGG